MKKSKHKKLNFPPYEWIKALPLTRKETIKTRSGDLYEDETFIEYAFTLFKLPIAVYGRFTYNEDGEGFIIFDVMQEGYCDHNRLGNTQKFNKKNYTAICKYAQSIYELFLDELERDCTQPWLNMSPDEYAAKFGY